MGPGLLPDLNTSDGYVVKLDGKGRLLWQRTLITEGTDAMTAVASSGEHVFVAGATRSELVAGEHKGGTDCVLGKLDPETGQQGSVLFLPPPHTVCVNTGSSIHSKRGLVHFAALARPRHPARTMRFSRSPLAFWTKAVMGFWLLLASGFAKYAKQSSLWGVCMGSPNVKLS